MRKVLIVFVAFLMSYSYAGIIVRDTNDKVKRMRKRTAQKNKAEKTAVLQRKPLRKEKLPLVLKRSFNDTYNAYREILMFARV